MKNKRISPLVILPPVIFLIIALGAYIGLKRDNPDALPSTLVGRMVPELQAIPLGALPMAVQADFTQPGVKLVNFWASWCGPCRIEHPNLLALADSGIPVIGLNYKDSERNALRFLEDLGNPFVKSAAVEGRAALDWGVYGIPETFLIDSNGMVLMRTAGPLTQRIMRQKLLPAIKAARRQ